MRLTFLGHSAIRLEIGEHDVLIDPFLSGNPRAPVAADDLEPTHVLLTHGHADHVGDAVAIATRAGATVVSGAEIATWVAAQGVRDTIGMNVGGGTELPSGRVSLTPAWHSNALPDGSYGGMPIHYDTFPPIRQDVEAFREDVAARTDARCHVLEPGQSLRL